MLYIGDFNGNFNDLIIQKYPGKIESIIVKTMINSSGKYRFRSLDQLDFEVKTRLSIIDVSRRLAKSSFDFKVFDETICNPKYWKRTQEGGFLLLPNANPFVAIKDILHNSHLYGTECSTAIIIVFYLALVEVLPEELFNKLFKNIHLMDWTYIDNDLGLTKYRYPADYFPGDCRYFNNPGHNPSTPEWQGENVIDLGDGTYYGHGMGILSKDQIIKELNENRRMNSTQSSYLLKMATRINFKSLYYEYSEFTNV